MRGDCCPPTFPRDVTLAGSLYGRLLYVECSGRSARSSFSVLQVYGRAPPPVVSIPPLVPVVSRYAERAPIWQHIAAVIQTYRSFRATSFSVLCIRRVRVRRNSLALRYLNER